ncbi:ABC transporter permease [Olivibacter sp. CPCC 100613]|uniref:ABC transporter permease n=1 Tax=Olivibacter sp. CPCC 100613 TaxID=3079931 RepID=UPI002FFB1A24
MIKNYLKMLLRDFLKSKAYSLINISGLSIGMAAVILIMLWVQNELSMERFHEKEDRIYVMYNRDINPDGNRWAWNNTPKILAPTLKTDYPEIEDATRFTNINFLLTVGEKKLNVQGAFTDSSFFNIFTFPLLHGNARKALSDGHSIVLTEKFAKTLFGNENAMGKIIRIDSSHNATVTGIMKDLPNNTLLEFDYLLPWDYLDQLGENDTYWGNNSTRTYALLKTGASRQVFDDKVRTITIDHTKGSEDASTTEVFTQSLSRYYLYGKSENAKLVAGNMVTVRLFIVLAIFILLIACINFMNMSTARSERRAKEVGIRKVAGVRKEMLILQFLIESTLLSIFSFLIAILMVQLSLGPFNQLVNKTLFIPYGNLLFWLCALGFILLTGIMAGSYPAFYLSSFRPVSVLKGTFKKTNALVTPRKILVTIQFTIAIVLIIATIIVYHQVQYGLKRDTGYAKDNVVFIFTEGNIGKHYTAIKNELLNKQLATSVTLSANPITQRWSDSWGFYWDGSTKTDEKIDFLRLGSDADFAKTFNINITQGRDIDVYQYPTDSMAIVLNETAVKAMRLTNPIGTQIHQRGGDLVFHVVGVVKDFIIESPFQQNMSPLMVFGPKGYSRNIVHIKLNPINTTTHNLAGMEKILKAYNPQYPFRYIFADEDYAQKFQNAERTGKLAGLFACLTILISCLGLFGLSAYMSESRTKEIGIRKVLGASVWSVTQLLSLDFLKLVIISFVIASPIAWFAMDSWLESYSYRIGIEWWVFVLTGVLAITIALLTVSSQAIKAAVANPIKSLREE